MSARAGFELSDAVVVLTGAGGGIGQALTRRLVAAGARVAMVDRDETALAALVREHRGRATSHPFDLRELERLEGLAADVVALHGGVDVLINNAGLTVHAPFASQSRAQIDDVLDVDLRAAIHTTRVFLPHLSAAAGAHVVFVSSMAGRIAFPTQTTYSAAKFGLCGFAAALRMELAGEGIGVSTILPGTVATGLLRSADSHDAVMTDKLASLMERFGTAPARVADVIVDAIEHDRGSVRVGWDCWLASALDWLLPPALPFVLRRAHELALRRGKRR